jgi:crotonobetainyl-CoA:carnitine CoA-transferase CaiB-like acyl-CoA transferase
LSQALQEEMSRYPRQYLLDQFKRFGVPAGAVYNMQEVFEQPEAAAMILYWNLPDGTPVQSVRSAAFKLE